MNIVFFQQWQWFEYHSLKKCDRPFFSFHLCCLERCLLFCSSKSRCSIFHRLFGIKLFIACEIWYDAGIETRRPINIYGSNFRITDECIFQCPWHYLALASNPFSVTLQESEKNGPIGRGWSKNFRSASMIQPERVPLYSSPLSVAKLFEAIGHQIPCHTKIKTTKKRLKQIFSEEVYFMDFPNPRLYLLYTRAMQGSRSSGGSCHCWG